MKTIKFLLICIVVVCLTGCAGLNTTAYQNDPVETKVVLSGANYKIVKEVEGEWSAVYIFGIGGLSKKALTNNAVGKMYENAKLTGNQQIINITTTVSSKNIMGVYSKSYAKAHGYVIEFE